MNLIIQSILIGVDSEWKIISKVKKPIRSICQSISYHALSLTPVLA